MSDERLAQLQSHRDELDARFRSYDGGDRPMSPPVKLIRELAMVEAELRAAKDAAEESTDGRD